MDFFSENGSRLISLGDNDQRHCPYGIVADLYDYDPRLCQFGIVAWHSRREANPGTKIVQLKQTAPKTLRL